MVRDKPKQSRANIQVHIRDVNDNSPEFLTDSYEVFVAENVGPGSTIAWIRAEDKDSGILGNLIQFLVFPFLIKTNLNNYFNFHFCLSIRNPESGIPPVQNFITKIAPDLSATLSSFVAPEGLDITRAGTF